MVHRKSFLASILAAALLGAHGGCVIYPGSAGSFIDVNGQLLSANGKPFTSQTVKVVIPGEHGLTASERAHAAPALIRWFESLRTTRTQTDADGMFVARNSFVYHVDVWVFPKLGVRPKQPPPPVFFVELSEEQSDLYLVDLTGQSLRYRVFQRHSGREIPADQAQRCVTQATAKMAQTNIGNGWSVSITFQRAT